MEINIIHMLLIICPLVLVGGFVDAIGGGGGLITLPAYLLAGLPVHTAIATNKFSSSIGTTISTFKFIKNKQVDFSLILPTVFFGLIGSFIGAKLSLYATEKLLENLLLFVLPIVAFYILKNKSFGENNTKKEISRNKALIVACLASFIIGAYDGFYGPGTGTFLILVFVCLLNMEATKAGGNAKIINLTSNLCALIVFILNGKVNFILGLYASIFSILGHYLGSSLAIKNGSKIIKPIIIIVLLLLFVKIIFKI